MEPSGTTNLSRTAWAVQIAICFAVALLEGFDIQALGVAAPRLIAALDLSPEEAGLAFAMSNVGIALGAALGGRLSDHFGRKPVFAGCVATFGVFTLMTTLAADGPTLIAARLLTGLGLGAAFPGMMAMAVEISPPAQRVRTATMMFCGMPAGGAASALVVAGLGESYDWRVVFLIGGVLPVLLTPIILLGMRETFARPDIAAARRGVFSSLFAGGRGAATLLTWLAFLPCFFALYLILNWLPTLVVAKGFERTLAAEAALFFNIGGIVGALLLGVIVDRVGFRAPLALAMIALTLTFVGLSMTTTAPLVLAAAATIGALLLGVQFCLYGVAPRFYPQDGRGTGAGAASAVGRIGSILGPMTAGALLGQGASASDVIGLLAPAAGLAAAAIVALGFVRMHDAN
jgi:AAHS family 3-hydroxyphenylpropionic acid transporter